MLGMKFSICGASRLETEMGETSRESARQNESSRSTSPSSVSAKDVAALICSCRPTSELTGTLWHCVARRTLTPAAQCLRRMT